MCTFLVLLLLLLLMITVHGVFFVAAVQQQLQLFSKSLTRLAGCEAARPLARLPDFWHALLQSQWTLCLCRLVSFLLQKAGSRARAVKQSCPCRRARYLSLTPNSAAAAAAGARAGQQKGKRESRRLFLLLVL